MLKYTAQELKELCDSIANLEGQILTSEVKQVMLNIINGKTNKLIPIEDKIMYSKKLLELIFEKILDVHPEEIEEFYNLYKNKINYNDHKDLLKNITWCLSRHAKMENDTPYDSRVIRWDSQNQIICHENYIRQDNIKKDKNSINDYYMNRIYEIDHCISHSESIRIRKEKEFNNLSNLRALNKNKNGADGFSNKYTIEDLYGNIDTKKYSMFVNNELVIRDITYKDNFNAIKNMILNN